MQLIKGGSGTFCEYCTLSSAQKKQRSIEQARACILIGNTGIHCILSSLVSILIRERRDRSESAARPFLEAGREATSCGATRNQQSTWNSPHIPKPQFASKCKMLCTALDPATYIARRQGSYETSTKCALHRDVTYWFPIMQYNAMLNRC